VFNACVRGVSDGSSPIAVPTKSIEEVRIADRRMLMNDRDVVLIALYHLSFFLFLQHQIIYHSG